MSHLLELPYDTKTLSKDISGPAGLFPASLSVGSFSWWDKVLIKMFFYCRVHSILHNLLPITPWKHWSEMRWLKTFSSHCLSLCSPPARVLVGLLSFWTYGILVNACPSSTQVSTPLHWDQTTVWLCPPSLISSVAWELNKTCTLEILGLRLRESSASLLIGAGAIGVKVRGTECQFPSRWRQHTVKKKKKRSRSGDRRVWRPRDKGSWALLGAGPTHSCSPVVPVFMWGWLFIEYHRYSQTVPAHLLLNLDWDILVSVTTNQKVLIDIMFFFTK